MEVRVGGEGGHGGGVVAREGGCERWGKEKAAEHAVAVGRRIGKDEDQRRSRGSGELTRATDKSERNRPVSQRG